MEQEKVEMRKAVEEDVLGFPEEDRELARLLIRAARDEIHRDYENAHSRRYKEFLLHIENELTDPKLNVTTARSVAGLTGTSTYATEFSRIVGMNPGAYIEHHRMKLARRLLQHTGGRAKITCVALAVGYENSNYFSDRYNKVMDYRPRREPRADSGSSSALLQQLTKAEATRRQQPHKPEKKCDHYVPQGEGVSAFWEEIRSLDRKGVLDYLSHNSRRLDTHHFSFLLEKSKLEGRKSRERGEELALISLDCLRAIELRKGCDFINEKVLGYTALAKARRLRLDFVGANEAFEAIDMIRLERTKPEVYLQVNISKAHLQWWWKRDVRTSLGMVKSIISEVRDYGSSEFLIIVLNLAGDIHETCGHPERALSVFEEAVERCRFVDDPYLALMSHYNLAYLCASLSKGQRAAELLTIVNQLQDKAGYCCSSVYVTLLVARIHRANGDLRIAEPSYLEARDGFSGMGLDIYVALISLELALLYLDLSQPERAFSMAFSSIDCISLYSCHKEAMAALALLQESSGTAIINKAMLNRALRHLEMVRKDPAAFSTRVGQALDRGPALLQEP